MRCTAALAVVASLAAGGALADVAAPVECDVVFPPAPAPPPGAAEQPSFGNVFFTAPPFGVVGPRNTKIRLGGAVADVAAGFFAVEIKDGAGGVIASHVEGGEVVVDGGLLPANAQIRAILTPTDTNPCTGCFGPQEHQFSTNDVVDEDAPVFGAGDVVANGYVLPSIAEQQQCGFFGGTTHTLEVQTLVREPVRVTIGARSARDQPTLLLNGAQQNGVQSFSLSFGNSSVFAIGDPVVVVVVAEDLAGNVSAPAAVRLRMRSFRDRTPGSLPPSLTCDLDEAPEVLVPQRLPRNPSVRVVFPFEELPLALRPVGGGADVPLVPVKDVVDDARAGHVFVTAANVDAGDYDVVGLPCSHCLCAGCNVAPTARVTVDDVVDEEAPAAPEVLELLDDPSPKTSTEECVADDAATFVVLAAAEDDVAGAADLLYDVVIEKEGDLPRPAGTALPALLRGDGTVAVRVPTAPFGRLVGSNFTMTLTARDAGGHTARTVYENVVERGGGCGGGSGAAVVGVLALLRRRRRR